MRSVKRRLCGAAVIVAAAWMAAPAEAFHPHMWPLRRAENYNWHAGYSHLQYGPPVAMVVPPTANLQTKWGG